VLDPIVEAYVEDDRAAEDLVAAGADRDVVRRVVAMIDRAEYKRRQAAPGVKISLRNFGRDRRYPIVNKFREEVTGAAQAPKPVAAAPRVAAPRADGGEVS
jgi:NAD+ synthase (glutamine-hydrolysing)